MKKVLVTMAAIALGRMDATTAVTSLRDMQGVDRQRSTVHSHAPQLSSTTRRSPNPPSPLW